MPPVTGMQRRVRRVGVVTAGLVLVGLVALGGCSDDEPLITQPRVEDAPVPSVPVSSPTKDGQPADAAQVAAVVARISDLDRANRPVGIDEARAFFRVQVLALGLTDTEADCAADRMVASGGDAMADATMDDLLSGTVAVDASTMSQCVPPDRLAALAATPPDFTKVVPQMREVMNQLSVAGMADAGLGTDEAVCVSERTIAAIPDDQLTEAIGGLGTINSGLPEAVAACLTAARIAELAAA
jgi:hypothetical protein